MKRTSLKIYILSFLAGTIFFFYDFFFFRIFLWCFDDNLCHVGMERIYKLCHSNPECTSLEPLITPAVCVIILIPIPRHHPATRSVTQECKHFWCATRYSVWGGANITTIKVLHSISAGDGWQRRRRRRRWCWVLWENVLRSEINKVVTIPQWIFSTSFVGLNCSSIRAISIST
jgi:hypothetical protein